jgi:hypothetical protein
MTYGVSATNEIRHADSLIARYLRTTFPHVRDLAADFAQQVCDTETLAPVHLSPEYPWAMVGTAIDYRLRFLFEKLPVTRLQAFRSAQGSHVGDKGTALGELAPFSYGPENRITVYVPSVAAELFIALRDFQRRVRPARRDLSRDDEAWLCRYCAALALVDTKWLGTPRSQHPLRVLPPGSTLDDLFALIPTPAVADVCRLSRLFQEGVGREWLRQQVSFDPHVWVGNIGASPDVLVGDVLLDLKTTVRPHLERAWLDQLLLYALVVGDHDKIRRIGFHLLRQGRTVSWPIEEFMTRASGVPDSDFKLWSNQFFKIAARSSHMSPQERRTAAL